MDNQKITREYNGSDAFMLQSAQTIKNLFEDDLAQFTAFDSTLDADFLADYTTKYNAAKEVSEDSTIAGAIEQETEQVIDAMKNAREMYGDLAYFAEKAFKKNSLATYKQFTGGYAKARNNQPQMIQFLKSLKNAATKYQTELESAGMNPDLIEEIDEIRTALDSNNEQQEELKKGRGVATEQRIKTLNACYQKMAAVNRAAQRVFKNEFTKRQQYIYLPNNDTNDSETFAGQIEAGATLAITQLRFISNRLLTINNTGTVPLQFALSSTQTPQGNLIDLGGGQEIRHSMQEFIKTEEDALLNLLVINTSAQTAGSYEVEVSYD